MKPSIALLCCAAFALVNQNASANMVYGTVVDFGHAGVSTFPGAPPYTPYFFDDPFTAGGAPDGLMVQIDDDSYITLDFGAVWSSGTLSIYTYDITVGTVQGYPADAKIDLSVDGVSFYELTPVLSDAQGPVGPPYPHADLPVNSAFRYVRVTDLVEIDPDLNFDLDAVGFEASTTAVPEPTSMALLGLGTLGFAVCRRIAGRRRQDAE